MIVHLLMVAGFGALVAIDLKRGDGLITAALVLFALVTAPMWY